MRLQSAALVFTSDVRAFCHPHHIFTNALVRTPTYVLFKPDWPNVILSMLGAFEALVLALYAFYVACLTACVPRRVNTSLNASARTTRDYSYESQTQIIAELFKVNKLFTTHRLARLYDNVLASQHPRETADATVTAATTLKHANAANGRSGSSKKQNLIDVARHFITSGRTYVLIVHIATPMKLSPSSGSSPRQSALPS